MFKLKYSEKLGLIISITSSLVILLSFGIFLLLFYITSISQIRTSLISEANEIIDNYIQLDNEELGVKNIEDLDRDTLRDRVSLSIYNKDQILVNSFGLFSQKSPEKLFNDEGLFKLKLGEVIKSKKSDFSSLSQKNGSGSYELLITPLVNSGNILGVLVIISPIETVNKILNNSVYLIFTILPLAIILMYLIGRKLGNSAFSPVRKLVNSIKQINHSNLDIEIKPEGHEDDETNTLTIEFNNLLSRLKDAFSKQKKFISNSSHELRTPLARLQTSLGIIKSNEEIKEEMSEEITDMSNTLNRLSLLSKLENTSRDVKEVNLLNFINDMKKDSRVKVEIDKTYTLKIDPTDLNIILENLIGNALKYSKKEVTVGNKDNYFFVKDMGIGIPKEELDNVINPFFRAKNAISKSIEGNGLGLSIVKEICDIYGFKMKVISEIDKGSEFRIIDIS